MAADAIEALLPRSAGHQFVMYGDSCSGVVGALHERTFASINAIVRRLAPPPKFILFPGDEIIGLTPDPAALRAQWKHWLDVEMGWLDRARTPMWHSTDNHTAYDATPMQSQVPSSTELPKSVESDSLALLNQKRRLPLRGI